MKLNRQIGGVLTVQLANKFVPTTGVKKIINKYLLPSKKPDRHLSHKTPPLKTTHIYRTAHHQIRNVQPYKQGELYGYTKEATNQRIT